MALQFRPTDRIGNGGALRVVAITLLGGVCAGEPPRCIQIRSKRVLSGTSRRIGEIRIVTSHALWNEVAAWLDCILVDLMRDGLAINGKRERLSHAQIVERRSGNRY